MLSSDVGIRLAATHEEDKPGMEAVDLGPLPFVPAVYLEARTTSSSSVSLQCMAGSASHAVHTT